MSSQAEDMESKFEDMAETQDLMDRISDLNPGYICVLYDPNKEIVVNQWAPAFCALIGMIIGVLVGMM